MTKWITLCQWSGLLLPLLLSCAASAQNTTPPEADAVLRDDVRLQRLVDVNATGVALKYLLREVGGQEVALSAAPSCAEQKLQIHLKHRSIAPLMRALAQLLPGTWQPASTQHGYRLTLLPRAGLRREEWWKRFEEARQQALSAQRDHLLQQMRAAQRPGTYYNVPAKTIEAQQAGRSFFNQLPASLQEQIVQQMNENPFYKSRPTFGTSDREGALSVPLSDLPPSVQEIARAYIARRSQQYNLPGNADDAVVSFTSGLGVQASLTLADGQWTGTAFQMVPTPLITSQAAALMLDHTELTNEVHRHRNTVPPEWLPLAAFHDSKVWQNSLPAKRLYDSNHPPRRSQVLQQLADNTDIEFVSDYYCKRDFPIKVEEKPVIITRALPEELNDIAAEQDTSWKKDADDITLFRNNRWYRDDYLEVPAPQMLQWQEQRNNINKHPIASSKNPGGQNTTATDLRLWDWQADIVSRLTPWQIANGFKYFVPPPQKPVSDSPASNQQDATAVPILTNRALC